MLENLKEVENVTKKLKIHGNKNLLKRINENSFLSVYLFNVFKKNRNFQKQNSESGSKF